MKQRPTYKDLEQQVDILEKKITELNQEKHSALIPKENYKHIFEMIPTSIIIVDKVGKTIDINPFHINHIGKGEKTKEDYLGQKITDNPAIIKAELCDAYMSVLDGEPLNIPSAYFPRSSGGNEVYFSIRGEPIFMNGEVIGAIFVHEDLTKQMRTTAERLQLEKKLSQSQKLESLGVLAGGIAHDFNNLLTGILGNAELALLDISPVSPAINSIKQIQKAAHRSAKLTQQMLAYSGKGKFVIEPININEVVEEMAHLIKVSISKKVVIKYNFTNDIPAIEADATQICQVIMNMITNASEAIGEKSGVINITTGVMECNREYLEETWIEEERSEGIYTYFEVSDNGCGINEKKIAKIFDPFFTTKFTGRGLGLSAVLGIIRSHKGTIKIYSEIEKGTTFKALFPAIDQEARPINIELPVTDWRGSGTILLVDDEKTVRDTGKQILERIGFNVIIAEDGQLALDIFRRNPNEIVCILLDLTMPNMDGVETFRELRLIKHDVKVILSSGYNEHDIINQFSGKSLSGFIQKPYQLEKLISKLKKIL